VTTFFIRKVMRLVNHHQIGVYNVSTSQRVEQLIAVNLSGSDNEGRIRSFLSPVRMPTLSAPNSSMNSWYFEFVSAFKGVVYQHVGHY
jgi:hypothetical protein